MYRVIVFVWHRESSVYSPASAHAVLFPTVPSIEYFA